VVRHLRLILDLKMNTVHGVVKELATALINQIKQQQKQQEELVEKLESILSRIELQNRSTSHDQKM